MIQKKLLAASYTTVAVLALANMAYAGSSPACMGMVCVDFMWPNPPRIFHACNAETCPDTEQCPVAVTMDGFTYCTCPTSASNFCNIGYHDNQNGTVTLRCVSDNPCPAEEECVIKFEEEKPPPQPITNFWCVCE